MIHFERHQLANGLTILVQRVASTPLAVANISYQVGTRNEQPHRTGMAHLFEHLMFGGTAQTPIFDRPIQLAGGDNNAYTNQDFTTFFEFMPADNIEVALFLEADRMQNLALHNRTLEIQKKVVIEEFKETCLNEPFGDMWHHLGPLAYPDHPYRFPVIGASIDHIADVQLDEAHAFYKKFYCPSNAVLSVVGQVDPQDIFKKAEYWFGDLDPGKAAPRRIPQHLYQAETKYLDLRADVPVRAIFMTFRMAARDEQNFYVDDLLSDVLAMGKAARLPLRLMNERELFSDIDAYITGTIDEGLFVIEGRLNPTVSFAEAETAIWEELELLREEFVSPKELQRLQNTIETEIEFSEANIMTTAGNLCFYEWMGDVQRINEEGTRYQAVRVEDLQARARFLFRPERAVVLRYTPMH